MNLSDFRLIAAPFSPFTESGQLNLSAVEQQARLLAETSVDGAFVGGSTGEFASLSMDERIALARRWIQVGQSCDLDVIVHVGDTCQANAIRLATEAQQDGADAIAALAPFYFKPDDVGSLIEFLAPIAAAASDLPFYFYDIPSMTGARLPMVEFLKQAKPRIPNLVGLKYSNHDLMQIQECIQLHDGEFEVLFGCDEFLLAGVAVGVHGAIGSTYNFAAPLYRQMLSAFAAGNMEAAQAHQARSAELVRSLMRFGFMSACKALMSKFGVDCGPIRPPFRNLSTEQLRLLDREMDRLSVLELSKLCGPTSPSEAHELDRAIRG